MILTITTTHRPATDLGYLLHKNPGRAQSFPLTFGQAHVVYPVATPERCTAALILDIDPVGLVRGKAGGEPLEQYVNDRPYTASSFLSVAIAEVFATALGGRSKDRPELADTPIPLEATVDVLPCRGGEGFLRRLFEPLGYQVQAAPLPLDLDWPEWGDSPYLTVSLSGTVRLCDLLKHLYVLIPVLDDQKHYYVGDAEVEKLLRHGDGWLALHPEREAIARRYLRHQTSLTRSALARLVPEEGEAEPAEPEGRSSLHAQRLAAVLAELKRAGARRVLDLGCGEGRLLALLQAEDSFAEIVGMDISHRVLEKAAERLRLDRLPASQQGRIRLIHGSLTYKDQRLAGYDAAAVVEVIEHLEPHRLNAFERVLFEAARPTTVVLTTPNREYNALFASMEPGGLRHGDHRFEWSRAEFAAWAERVAARFGYQVTLSPIGPEDPVYGAPSQMAVFTRNTEAERS
jgi:3' terminal RNA ribose 2'-O-methyltransferase Hen1